jgi:nucleotide-binding universal stress UspA family protein
MYHKILVALDRRAIADKVFETALYLGKSFHAELNLVNILSLDVATNTIGLTPFTVNYEAQLLEEAEEESHRKRQKSLENLQYLVKQAQQEKISAIYTQLYGDPGKAICEQADAWGADLILMGRRGHSQVSEIFLGSVSSYVIHHCHTAVHLVQI